MVERDGIYVWDGNCFRETTPKSEYIVPLEDDEVYLLYFHNRDCPHCNRFKPEFEEVLREEPDTAYKVYMVVCKWFVIECSNEDSKRAFHLYKIRSSPAVLAVVVRDHRVTYTTNLYTLAVIHRAQNKARDIIDVWRVIRSKILKQKH